MFFGTSAARRKSFRFCYPFGHVDERAIRSVQAACYGYACSVWPTGFTGDYALIRVNMLDGY